MKVNFHINLALRLYDMSLLYSELVGAVQVSFQFLDISCVRSLRKKPLSRSTVGRKKDVS